MTRTVARRVAFALMVLVTAWSLWAVAQTRHPSPAAHVEGAVSAEEGEGARREAEGETPPPMNWSDFQSTTPPFVASLVNFALLVAGYYWLGKKPIASALQARSETIAKSIEEAQRQLAEARQLAKAHLEQLEELEKDKRTARQSLVSAGEAERDRLAEEAEANAVRLRKESEFLVEQELKKLREDLLREAVDAAVLAAEGLLKARVTQADQERLADDYLADLVPSKLGPQAT